MELDLRLGLGGKYTMLQWSLNWIEWNQTCAWDWGASTLLHDMRKHTNNATAFFHKKLRVMLLLQAWAT